MNGPNELDSATMWTGTRLRRKKSDLTLNVEVALNPVKLVLPFACGKKAIFIALISFALLFPKDHSEALFPGNHGGNYPVLYQVE